MHAFRGIPYAQAPIGPLRFRAPEPVPAWEGVRPARSYGPAAPQIGPVNRLIRTIIGAAGRKQSQDCLYLNVWTPSPDARRRPVMVFIHGGAFILGSGSTRIYSGDRLARRGDVVVVTINYRLGALGAPCWQAACDDGDAPEANLMLRDQLAALRWVGDNIDAFGGDPDRVTVFGESAGAMSIGALLGAPSARGLFQRAILQSGAAHNVSGPEQAARIGREYLAALGIENDVVAQLGKCSVTELMRAQAVTTGRVGLDDGVMAWQPCVDGDLLPEQPLAAIARGAAAGVPVLIGTNRDEWKLFMATDRLRLDDEKLARRLAQTLPGEDAEGRPWCEIADEAYRRVAGARGRVASERWSAIQSDRIFHYPAARLADLQSDHQPDTYAYLFEWQAPLVGGVIGACHGLELPFVFGGARAALMRAGLVGNPSAQRLCNRMQDAWIHFARHGTPGHPGLPAWPAWSRSERNVMSLGDDCTLRIDPHARARAFWEPIQAHGETRFA